MILEEGNEYTEAELKAAKCPKCGKGLNIKIDFSKQYDQIISDSCCGIVYSPSPVKYEVFIEID